ncbi:MAG: amylo-alpha-1,6-glucosidase [Bacillota bacterium]
MRLTGLDLTLEAGTRREWLVANGLGGFASSTVLGINTRRYHGLLMAAFNPPAERHLLVSRVDETVSWGRDTYHLGASFYPGTVHPGGHRWLVRFELDPHPRWTYSLGRGLVLKELFMVPGENTVVLAYRLLAQDRAVLELAPLVNYRHYHHLNQERDWPFWQVAGERAVELQPFDGARTIHLHVSDGSYHPGGHWYRSMLYPVEDQRGLDHSEDHYQPGVFRLELAEGRPAYFWASTRAAPDLDPVAQHARAASEQVPGHRDARVRWLHRSAGAFVVDRRATGQKTLIAGYHWFSDWGRDAFIALPGVCLLSGRLEAAASIMATFAGARHRGLVPNRFPDQGARPEYNTIDASLWLFYAVYKYLQYGGDMGFVRRQLYPALVDIVGWYRRGTAYGIHAGADGLLDHDGEGLQLTWMDAKHGHEVFTPRTGKPVEINALWYNALRTLEFLARDGGSDESAVYGQLAGLVKNSFQQQFWNQQLGFLRDVAGVCPDDRLRPNQLLAVSLPYPVLEGEAAARVVEVCGQSLLTPYGLRTLSPDHPDYHPAYRGSPRERDRAYHQGTVWPWLLGPFLTALTRTNPDSSRRYAALLLEPLLDHTGDAGLGSVSEVFDGSAPHRPGGCIAQAWSVGEVLRAYHEDVLGGAPPLPDPEQRR